jgi:hypothetical protein
MENKNIKTNIKSLIFVFILLVGVTLATAQGVWTDAPKGTAPNNNIFGPITIGDENQEKSGQLVTSGIINNSGDFITYADLSVGNSSYKTPAYLFGDVFLPKMVLAGNAENQLCLSPEGKVKVCRDISFKAVSPIYYTKNNVVTFPTSTGVDGYVSYKIGQSQSCTTVNKTNTNWGGQTLIGTDANKKVTFSDWGTYDLQINCDGVVYTTTIKIGGKIIPTTVDAAIKYNLNLGASRPAYIYVVGAGGGASLETFRSYACQGQGTCIERVCVQATVGGNTNVKIGSTTLVSVNGGKGAQTGSPSSCPFQVGNGGTVAVNTLSSNYSNSGYAGDQFVGGCNGKPDSNNNLNTCSTNGHGTILPYGRGGSGLKGQDISKNQYGDRAGGGGAYASGEYTLPATGTLTTFVGAAGGKGGTTPEGQNGYISIEW